MHQAYYVAHDTV